MLYGIFSETERGSIDGFGFHGVASGSETHVADLVQTLSALCADEGISFFYDTPDNLQADDEALDRGFYEDDFDPTLTSYPAHELGAIDVAAVLGFTEANAIYYDWDQPTEQAVSAALTAAATANDEALQAELRRVRFKAGQKIYDGRVRFSFFPVVLRKACGSETSDDWVLVSDVNVDAIRDQVMVYPFPQHDGVAPSGFLKAKTRVRYWGHPRDEPSVEFFGRTPDEVILKAAVDLALQSHI